MKQLILILMAITFFSLKGHTQKEELRWAFGTRSGLDFSTAIPTWYSTNIFPGYESSASICNSAGDLLFYTNGFWIWNRDHEILPELTNGISGYTAPVAPYIGYPPLMPWTGGFVTQPTAIARMPADTSKYFVFSLSTNGVLYYSVVDITLNGGYGGIVAGKRGVILTTELGEKLTVVRGCNNIWVMVRSKSYNQYLAYEIRDSAIINTPVISETGHFPISWYQCGVIKFSNDGTKMAAACNKAWGGTGGIELYDFNVYSGVLSNAFVLDSSSTSGYYYGACFSPDNSKLYASTSSGYSDVFFYGKVRQFDLSLGNLAAIAASKIVVFNDVNTDLDRLGDLKRGADNKIYFSSGKFSANMHVINFPNLSGTACNPVANAIMLPMIRAERGLPNDIAVLPFFNTVKQVVQIVSCFKDSITITADTGKYHLWDDGTTGRERTITNSGIYTVKYTNTDCKNQEDTFKVTFLKLPALSHSLYNCPNTYQATAGLLPAKSDTTTFEYTWTDPDGHIIRKSRSNNGDSITGIDTGQYEVQIRTPGGCDTTLTFYVQPIPAPEASILADTFACTGIPVQFSFTGAVPIWKWHFGDNFSTSEPDPVHYYQYAGTYVASLIVTNIEGCRDTIFKTITVKSLDLQLNASSHVANVGEEIRLSTSADQPYTITAWSPTSLFADQSAYNQRVTMDTTRTFVVTGISGDGCIGRDSVRVGVNPLVMMPNAFSPNGDGLNDYFKPGSSGYILVRKFEVYNRYGNLVYEASGERALTGWDGTHNGKPCNADTYFYQIDMEVEATMKRIYLKGDIVLIR